MAAITSLLLAGVFAGCTTSVPASAPTSPPTVLLVRESSGGLCVSGTECRSVITVRTDGAWLAIGGGTRKEGTLGEGVLALLQEAVAATGLAEAPAFTGTCPVAYDGQEVTYRWTSAGAPRTAASCTVTFDPADPLVLAGERLVDETSA